MYIFHLDDECGHRRLCRRRRRRSEYTVSVIRV